MCGIFGYVTNGEDQYCNFRALQHIAAVTEARGRHAFGFAWIDPRGRLRCYKQAGAISQHLDALMMAADARVLIGHCRYATHGDWHNNLNNHPHTVDGGWLIHNGIIGEHIEINGQYDLHPVTDCDSETLALLIETIDGSLLDRCAAAAGICNSSSLAFAALWSQPRQFVLGRSGNPVHVGHDQTGTYFASLKDGLPKTARMLADHSCISFRFGANWKSTTAEKRIPHRAHKARALWD